MLIGIVLIFGLIAGYLLGREQFTKERKPGEKKDQLWILWSGILGILILWVVTVKTPAILRLFDYELTPNEFGDMFGSINALFSGLALAFIAYTLYLQRKEIAIIAKDQEGTLKHLSEELEILKKQQEVQEEERLLNKTPLLKWKFESYEPGEPRESDSSVILTYSAEIYREDAFLITVPPGFSEEIDSFTLSGENLNIGDKLIVKVESYADFFYAKMGVFFSNHQGDRYFQILELSLGSVLASVAKNCKDYSDEEIQTMYSRLY